MASEYRHKRSLIYTGAFLLASIPACFVDLFPRNSPQDGAQTDLGAHNREESVCVSQPKRGVASIPLRQK
jgi:hypothetical protein